MEVAEEELMKSFPLTTSSLDKEGGGREEMIVSDANKQNEQESLTESMA